MSLNILTPSLPIAAPPWKRLGKRIESQCRKAILEFSLLNGASKIAVALSGGKDSLTLLYMLKALSGRGLQELEIIAIHVGGEFSCGSGVSQEFLKGICKQLGVKFIVCTSDLKREDLECYSCSRKRRTLIFNAAKEEGATTIAFGHHKNDSVQTLLMNLLHKGEFAANLPKVPMVDYGITIIRPLLYVLEEEIKEFSRYYGFNRIVCQCPVGQNSMRKKAQTLIEEMESIFPNAVENLFNTALKHGSKKAATKS